MTAPNAATEAAVRRQWADKVRAGLREGTVQRSRPLYDHDRAPLIEGGPPRNVELIVEHFFGCKRATGVGSTEVEAAEVLAGNLAAYFVEGPIEPAAAAVAEEAEAAE